MSGRLNDGWAMIEPLLVNGATPQHSDRQRMFRLSEVLLLFGEVCLAVNRFGSAHGFAFRALELTRDGGVRGMEARALHLLGHTASQRDPEDIEGGEARCREGLALAEELGMRPLVAHCHPRPRQARQRDQAQEHVSTATTMYREMGMRFWLDKAEADG
jgi:hypothetical protein